MFCVKGFVDKIIKQKYSSINDDVFRKVTNELKGGISFSIYLVLRSNTFIVKTL